MWAEQAGNLRVESSAFKTGAFLAKRYSCDGADISPPLSWSAPPPGAKQFVVICDDPDAPGGTWVHWVLYGLAPTTLKLPEGIPPKRTILVDAKQGRNDFGGIGYGGPCPPRGTGAHRYFFKVYAVDVPPSMEAGATKAQVLRAIRGHILAEGRLMGCYRR
ncbi:MAG: YbhB/YbcL family Raf kinase inhibitor-like protein [Desulfobacterales bacterium]|nr:YbhB/YbcL family Raf kinase inhibitor-like protein [Desulfobacterales bacterium]